MIIITPINKEAITVESYTEIQGERAGQKVKQVIAEGDDQDPGKYVYIANIPASEKLHRFSLDSIVDIRVDRAEGAIIPGKGVWKLISKR